MQRSSLGLSCFAILDKPRELLDLARKNGIQTMHSILRETGMNGAPQKGVLRREYGMRFWERISLGRSSSNSVCVRCADLH